MGFAQGEILANHRHHLFFASSLNPDFEMGGFD
jgi:hypothetical protein